jgi:uncharacterized membrane protein
MSVLQAIVSRLRADQRGASLVELALMAPILLVMLAGTVDCARLISTKVRLQQAAERTVEMASAGGISTTSSSTVQTNMQNDATATAPSSQVSVALWLECNGTKQSDFNASCNTGDQVARYASVSLTDSYSPSFPWLFGRSATNRAIAVSGSASVRLQ